MVKVLISAMALVAVMGSSALACSGHKSGGKGGGVTATAPAIVVIAKTARA